MDSSGTLERWTEGSPLLVNLDRRPAFGTATPRAQRRANGYGLDGLVLTNADRGDRIQAHTSMRDIAPVLIEHLRDNGVNVTGRIVWTQEPVDLLRGETFLPCMYDLAAAPSNGQNVEWHNAVRRYRSKEDLVRAMEEFGLTGLLPWTQVFAAGERPQIPDNVKVVWVKRLIEVTGTPSVHGPVPAEQVGDAVRSFVPNEAYQVQEHVDGEDYSGQYFIDPRDGELVHLALTEQVVRDGHHVGNRVPGTQPEYGGLTHRIAQLLAEQGFLGFMGVDFLARALTARVSEFNLRINGSSPMAWVMKLLGYVEGYFEREVPVHGKRSLRDAIAVVNEMNAEPANAGGKLLVYHAGFFADDHTIGLMAVGGDSERRHAEAMRRLVA